MVEDPIESEIDLVNVIRVDDMGLGDGRVPAVIGDVLRASEWILFGETGELPGTNETA